MLAAPEALPAAIRKPAAVHGEGVAVDEGALPLVAPPRRRAPMRRTNALRRARVKSASTCSSMSMYRTVPPRSGPCITTTNGGGANGQVGTDRDAFTTNLKFQWVTLPLSAGPVEPLVIVKGKLRKEILCFNVIIAGPRPQAIEHRSDGFKGN
jgi:hypothetical protein